MRAWKLSFFVAVLPLVLVLGSPEAKAGTITAAASNNATVQPAGPRTGANGLNFVNIENSSAANFASFGVFDFTLPSSTAQSVTSLSLALTEANAAFSAPGNLQFFAVTNSTASIAAGVSTLAFNPSALPSGLGNQLGSSYALGTGAFNTTGNVNSGQLDTYSFTLTGAAQTFVSSIASSGGTLRLVIAPNDTAVAATFAGYSNSTYAAPQLTLQTAAVPEPASALLMLAGALVLWSTVRRHQA